MNAHNFDGENPFPLVSLDLAEGNSAKEHAKRCDEWLGFRIPEIEEVVRAERFGESLARFETWSHISPQVFLTPYLEIRNLLEKLLLAPGSTLVDLGAGYGRMAFVLERHFPEVKFLGIECVAHRVREFERVAKIRGLHRSRLIQGDLTSEEFTLPPAEAYFVYDCGTREAVECVIARLSKVARDGTQLLARGLRACQSVRASSEWVASGDFDYLQGPGLHAELFTRARRITTT